MTPRVAHRQVPVSVWAELTPVEYVRLLQGWAPSLLPHRDQGLGTLASIAILGGLALAMGGAAHRTNGQPDPGLLLPGLVLLVAGVVIWMAWLRRRNPDAADAAMGTLFAVGAYSSYRNGHRVTATINAANAAGYGYKMHQRAITEQQQRQDDADHLQQLAAATLEQQWQFAEWFRWSLQVEYSRRRHGAVAPENAPVPSYADVVAHLNANPTPW